MSIAVVYVRIREGILMKRIALFFLVSVFPLIAAKEVERQKTEGCELNISSEWRNLEDTCKGEYTEKFGGRWMLAGTFIFKNRSGDTVPLTELDLAWKGKLKISDLVGSLFKKEPNKEFMPVQDFLISDGHWNAKQQVLQLKFNERELIGLTTTFCLVLTVPSSLEKTLNDGHFTVIIDNLPRQLKKTVKKRRPILSISPTGSTKKRKHRLAYSKK